MKAKAKHNITRYEPVFLSLKNCFLIFCKKDTIKRGMVHGRIGTFKGIRLIKYRGPKKVKVKLLFADSFS